jgi:cytochrome c2
VACALLARPARADDHRLREAQLGEAKKTFLSRCTACHTYGHGVKVGPDLKGVTERRARPWLLRFIRSSQATIKSGDPVANELYKRFKEQRMPDWTDLSPAQVGALLDWLAIGGPEQKEPDERDAALATTAELELGRALFDGKTRLENGGLACGSCHAVHDGARASLGPDLSGAYLAYRDRALTLFLKHPCTAREPERSAPSWLTPREAFALKAYLRQVALAARPGALASAVLPSHERRSP